MEIKPCPHCNNKGEVIDIGELSGLRTYYVECSFCSATGSAFKGFNNFKSMKKSAIEWWNKREKEEE